MDKGDSSESSDREWISFWGVMLDLPNIQMKGPVSPPDFIDRIYSCIIYS